MQTSSTTNEPGYFKVYVDQVQEDDLPGAFSNQFREMSELFYSITEEQSHQAYAPGKWTIKELLQHLLDAERIFCYRALCFSRKETAVLPSFDENEYANQSFANDRPWQNLVDELITLRQSTRQLFDGFTPDMLRSVGKAGTNNLSVEQLGFITVGHMTHHIKIIRERYLA